MANITVGSVMASIGKRCRGDVHRCNCGHCQWWRKVNALLARLAGMAK